MDVGAPVTIALLQTQRVDGTISSGNNTERLPCFPEGIPQFEAVFHRGIELPAELTDVGDAQSQDGNFANRDLLSSQIGKGCIGEIILAHLLHQVTSTWSPYTNAAAARGDVVDVDEGAISRHVLA